MAEFDFDLDNDVINPNKDKIIPLIDNYKNNIRYLNEITGFDDANQLFKFEDIEFKNYNENSYINMLIIKNIVIDNFISLKLH